MHYVSKHLLQLMNLCLRLKAINTLQNKLSHLLHWSLSLNPTLGNLDRAAGSCEMWMGFHTRGSVLTLLHAVAPLSQILAEAASCEQNLEFSRVFLIAKTRSTSSLEDKDSQI